MRIQEVVDTLSGVLSTIRPSFTSQGGSSVKVSLVAPAVDAWRTLEAMPVAKKINEISKFLLNKQPGQVWYEGIIIDQSEMAQYSPYIDELLTLVSSLIESLERMLTTIEKPHISVRLPETTSLEDLAMWSEQLDRALAKTLREVFGVEVRLRGVDRGSIWVELVVVLGVGVARAAPEFAKNLPKILKAFFDGVSKIIETRARHQMESAEAERFVIESELRAQGEEIRRKIQSGVADSICEQLLALRKEAHDPEAHTRIKQGLEIMATVVERGGRILHALPESIDGSMGSDDSEAKSIDAPALPKQLPPSTDKKS